MRLVKHAGIYQHGAGFRAVVSMGHGKPPVMKQFPPTATVADMQNWREDTRAHLRVSRKRRATRGSFEGDALRYLETVKAMPTIKERKYEIGLWTKEFGTRNRDTITAAEIRAVRDRWMITKRGPKQPPIANATVNKRLRALSNLFTVLDGRRSENPVRDVPELREPKPVARAMSYENIAAIIAAMPDRGRPGKGGIVPTVSYTKIRVRCLAYCQITPRQLATIKRPDLDLVNGRLRLPARKKGRGADALWVDLLPEALKAFKDFDANDLYGKFSQQSLRHSWQHAAAKLNLRNVRPYDMRHTYGSMIYRATKNRAAVQELMQHSQWSTSARYALSAMDEVRAGHSAQVLKQFETETR